MVTRGVTIKGCIKRIKGITITDLKKLSTRDLKALIKLFDVMVPIQMELTNRQVAAMGRPAPFEVANHSGAQIASGV